MPGLSPLIEAATEGRRAPPGISVAVVNRDQVVASGAAGFADVASGSPMSVDGACNWFSMTKIATATSAMMLAEQGSLDLDATVGSYLGDRWPRVLDRVLVRHLLNHSGGLRNPIPIRWIHRAGEPKPDPSEFLSRVLARQRRPRLDPGSRASYSNVGYLAAGQVIAAAAGRPYEAFVTEELLRPLGMTQTAFSWRDCPSRPVTAYQHLPGVLVPVLKTMLPPGLVGTRTGALVALRPFEVDGAAYGGLIGPVNDAAKLVALFTNRGSSSGVRLLRAATCQIMTTIATPGRHYDLGFGWFRPHGASSGAEHLGGGMGYWNLLRMRPEEGIGVAVMSNVTHHWDIEGLAERLLEAASPE